MKTRPSIQFDAMSGTAGEVTARSTRFGTILSGRARQPGRVTPQQKDMRALFARVRKLQTICKSIIQYCRDAFLNEVHPKTTPLVISPKARSSNR